MNRLVYHLWSLSRREPAEDRVLCLPGLGGACVSRGWKKRGPPAVTRNKCGSLPMAGCFRA